MNNMKIVSLVCAFSLILIILPLADWFVWLPEWYGNFINSVICAGALWMAWKHYRQKSFAIWNLSLLMIAVYYNPIFKIEFESRYINILISLMCFVFFIFFAFRKEIPEDTDDSK